MFGNHTLYYLISKCIQRMSNLIKLIPHNEGVAESWRWKVGPKNWGDLPQKQVGSSGWEVDSQNCLEVAQVGHLNMWEMGG